MVPFSRHLSSRQGGRSFSPYFLFCFVKAGAEWIMFWLGLLFFLGYALPFDVGVKLGLEYTCHLPVSSSLEGMLLNTAEPGFFSSWSCFACASTSHMKASKSISSKFSAFHHCMILLILAFRDGAFNHDYKWLIKIWRFQWGLSS